MANRLTHYLRGTKHMEGAWPEGTEVNEYGDLMRGEEPGPFLADLGAAVQGVPSAMVEWWRDSHRWTRDKYIYEVVPDTGLDSILVRFEHPDYRLWRTLGRVSDALIMLIVLIVVLAVFL